MRVGIECQRYACVSEPFAYHLRMFICSKQQSCACMTEVVQAESRGKISAFQNLLEMKAVDNANLFLVADREGFTIELNWDQLSVTGPYDDTCPRCSWYADRAVG